MPDNNVASKIVDIVQASGGTLVGRTRLQKIAYLLEAAGCGNGFQFSYHYYGPYSEQVADAILRARISGELQEEEKPTDWGTTYSIYTTTKKQNVQSPSDRNRLITAANDADAVDLELAATAAYLAKQGSQDAWASTKNLKPNKATHLESAKKLYANLRQISPKLPKIK